MFRHGNAAAAFAYFFVFWTFAPFIDRDELFNILNGLAMSLVIGLLISWIPAVWTVLKERYTRWTSGYYLVFGMYSLAWFLAFQLAARIYWRTTDDIRIFNSLPMAWSVWGTVGALFLCMISQDIVKGKVPPRNWVSAGRWVAGGLAIAAVVRVFFFPA